MSDPSMGFSEDAWEQLALETLAQLAWKPLYGKDIAPGTGARESWAELAIRPRLLEALRTHNPTVPAEYLAQALAEILIPKSIDALTENHRIHTYLVDGFRGITYVDQAGQEVTPTIRLLSPNPDDNEWLAVNQVTLRQGDHTRRFDVVLYCNGMPVSIIELKKASSQSADVAAAHAQLIGRAHV